MIAIEALNDQESRAFLELVANTHLLHTEDDFSAWCRDSLRRFLPFGMMLCAVGRLFGDMIVVDEMQGIDYPQSFIHQLSRRMALSERKVIQRWLLSREPQLVDQDNAASDLSELELSEFVEQRLMQIAAHGLIAPNGFQASYFSFSRLRGGLTPSTALKLRLVVPHLHQVRTQISAHRLQASEGMHPASRLTPRELEVLRWMFHGKPNAQMAALLERSAQTVKNQVAAVLEKLGAANKAQAVARAMELGITAMYLEDEN